MGNESAAETSFTPMESTVPLDFVLDRANSQIARDYSETTRPYVELAATENRLRSFRYLLPWCEGQPILDLGCAKGTYLRQFAAGSLGVDVSRPNLEHCQKLGLRAVDVDLNRDLPIPSGSFPVIFCSHVLEHVDAPIHLLRECHRVLTPGGRLVLGLPIETSVVNWVRGQRYFYHHPGHLYSFSIENIDALLRKTGFKIERFYFEPRIVRLQSWLALMQILSPRIAYPLALAYWVVATKKSMESITESLSDSPCQDPIAK
jgi:SAM-dependent methyltransferase